MAKQKLYAVAKGRTIGIFASWDGPGGVTGSIDRFPGAQHRKFEGVDARAQAISWLVAQGAELPPELTLEAGLLIAEPVTETAEPAAVMQKEERPVYYAVAKGRRPGLYPSWYGAGGAKEQVAGLDDAVHRKFVDRTCALVFLHDNGAHVDEHLAVEIAAAVAALPPPPAGKDAEGRYQVLISADGCARGNGQGGEVRGGWASVLQSGTYRKELSGGLANTTSQRAELYAVLHGIEALRGPSRISLHSDSETVIKGFRSGYHLGNFAGAGNADLWARIAQACAQHVVEEASYRSDEHREIRRCHVLANTAAISGQLVPDVRMMAEVGGGEEDPF